MGFIKINKSLRHAVHEYAVARAGITMTNGLAISLQPAVRRRIMQRPKELGGRDALSIIDLAKLSRNHAWQIRQDLATALVHSQEPRRPRELPRFQVP
jgi:hypothetical protein